VVTRDYIEGMKTKTILKYPEIKPQVMELREAVALPGVGLSIPVRAAKAKFSALLELVAGGKEITITSDGKPKAKLVKAEPQQRGKVFTGMGDYLMKQPIHRGMTADEAIDWTRGDW
jgi:prevent-host-death family protein